MAVSIICYYFKCQIHIKWKFLSLSTALNIKYVLNRRVLLLVKGKVKHGFYILVFGIDTEEKTKTWDLLYYNNYISIMVRANILQIEMPISKWLFWFDRYSFTKFYRILRYKYAWKQKYISTCHREHIFLFSKIVNLKWFHHLSYAKFSSNKQLYFDLDLWTRV